VIGLNLKLEFLFSWKFPRKPGIGFRALKIDGATLYLTTAAVHQIFLCNSQNGKLLKAFGTRKQGSKDGEFSDPMGLTVDNKYVYICDQLNDRVQILIKENGSYYSKWRGGTKSRAQQFIYPNSIFHHSLENLIYVGDDCSVQIFSKDGVCIQRIGEDKGNQMNQFRGVLGICVGEDDRLYVSDLINQRIQIFKRSRK